MREQISSILALMEDAAIYLFEDAGKSMKSSLDTKVMSLIQTVVNRALAKVFEVPRFFAIGKAVQKSVSELPSVDEVTANYVASPYRYSTRGKFYQVRDRKILAS